MIDAVHHTGHLSARAAGRDQEEEQDLLPHQGRDVPVPRPDHRADPQVQGQNCVRVCVQEVVCVGASFVFSCGPFNGGF